MNKINILAVMSLGLFLSAPMYAQPQDPTLPTQDSKLPAPQERAPSEPLPESKSTLESEEKRKLILEEKKAKIVKKYQEMLDPMTKVVAKENKKKLQRIISEETDKITDSVAKALSKKPMFRKNLDMLSPETLNNNPLALKIVQKAEANVKEASAKMSEKFQNLTL